MLISLVNIDQSVVGGQRRWSADEDQPVRRRPLDSVADLRRISLALEGLAISLFGQQVAARDGG